MAADLEVAIGAVLVAASVGTIRESIFYGPPRDDVGQHVPKAAVFVLETGGFAPTPYMGGSSEDDFKRRTAQVTVRSNPAAYQAGKAQADAVWEALNKSQPASWVAWRPMTSAPTYVGLDEQSRHSWTINVLTEIRE